MRTTCWPVLLAAAGALAGCELADEQTSEAAVPARVVRVVDGDTLKVRVGSRRETVRLLGIDAPESVKPEAPVECGGRAAARHLRRLALTADGRGRTVRLVSDPSQSRRDRFDRLLAYAELTDGSDLGRQQLRAGWARVYVYGGRPFARTEGYRDAERAARRDGRGIWSSCSG